MRVPDRHKPAARHPVAAGNPPAHYLRGPHAFIFHYIKRRWPLFSLLFGAAMAAAVCASLSQYAMKLLVDAMAGAEEGRREVWWVLGLFIALIATESVLWR